MEKVAKAFLSADIPLFKLNNKHIKNLFHDIDHSFQSGTNCAKSMLQLSANELQRLRNAIHDHQVFQLLINVLDLA